MKLVFSKDEAAVIGYAAIELMLDGYEFNTKLVAIPVSKQIAPREPEYMGQPEPEQEAGSVVAELAYVITLTGTSPVIKMVDK